MSVSDLTRAIKHVLEDMVGTVAVTGELSNYKLHTSGHRYFTLKDAGAQISCVMWKSRSLSFRPMDGMNVVVRGALSVYPQRGTYQIDCTSMQPLGKGDLYMAFEALKQKLYEEGYFAPEHKKPLPQFPMSIGIATSGTGAAIRDILSTLERRMPACRIYLRPTLVQGEGAAQDIARAIADLHQTDCDVIIVGRGGGSIEDLWAFNTEEVAKAIFHSRIPVISAVGHEVDVTIADFVADVRAATPTAAAELAVRDRRELLAALHGTGIHLSKNMERRIELHRRRLEQIAVHPGFRRPLESVRNLQQEIDEYEVQLSKALSRACATAAQRLASVEAHLQSVHPLAPLRRGFALLKSNDFFIPTNHSLENYPEVEIVRNQETARAGILSVHKL